MLKIETKNILSSLYLTKKNSCFLTQFSIKHKHYKYFFSMNNSIHNNFNFHFENKTSHVLNSQKPQSVLLICKQKSQALSEKCLTTNIISI